jgi:hypothetical protein
MNLKLADLQALLYRLITATAGVEGAVAREPTLRESGLGTVITGSERLSPAERLGIYANAYFYRLHDILKEDFPCIYAVLGEVDFHNLITGYLTEYPPTEPSVLHAGRHLPDYLQTTNDRNCILISRWPFLTDLALLESACIEVFHGADAQVLEHTSLSKLPPDSWPSLRIRLHIAALILDLEWQVDLLMTAIKGKRQWEPPPRTSVTILVWRQNGQVRHRQLERGERAGLKAAASGADFGSVCAALADELAPTAGVNDVPEIIHRMFTSWVSDGILVNA